MPLHITQLDDQQAATGLPVVCLCMTRSCYFCHLLWFCKVIKLKYT